MTPPTRFALKSVTWVQVIAAPAGPTFGQPGSLIELDRGMVGSKRIIRPASKQNVESAI